MPSNNCKHLIYILLLSVAESIPTQFVSINFWCNKQGKWFVGTIANLKYKSNEKASLNFEIYHGPSYLLNLGTCLEKLKIFILVSLEEYS